MTESFGLFERFGVELEYMIVDKDTLQVKPITDEVLKTVTGEYTSDFENGNIAWSNELVLHVIELKTNGPAESLHNLSQEFENSVIKINEILGKFNAVLLPSGTHPFFEPAGETKLWPHENNPVYEAFDKIFGCSGHGWSNLQSTHINLPFKNDEQFGRLHAAIRFLLPIIPAIAASSPILDQLYTGFTDSRLEVYRKNQVKIPSITGMVIPEPVYSQKDYEEKIFKRIWNDIAPYDEEGILQYEWLNSRGAIARFERNTIEIRVMDIQECPVADIALTGLFISVLMELVNERFIAYQEQKAISTELLSGIFLNCVKHGETAEINDSGYLSAFGITGKTKIQANELWREIYNHITINNNILSIDELKPVETILSNGTLSTRIKKSVGENITREKLIETYKHLSASLKTNELFIP